MGQHNSVPGIIYVSYVHLWLCEWLANYAVIVLAYAKGVYNVLRFLFLSFFVLICLSFLGFVWYTLVYEVR